MEKLGEKAEAVDNSDMPSFSIAKAWASDPDRLKFSADAYAENLSQCPVTRTPMPGAADVYHVFRAGDVTQVCQDWQSFPSGSEKPRFGQAVIPIEIDPPMHTQYRKLLNGLMSPRRLMGYEADAREFIEEGVAKLVAHGGGDVSQLCRELPLKAFCLLLGEEDTSILEINRKRREASPGLDDSSEEATQARKEQLAPVRAMVRRRVEAVLANPGDDLASEVAHGEIDGRKMTPEEAENMLTILYMAGTGTTTAGMQGTLLRLAMHQDAQEILRREPRKIAAAIEECLRLESPTAMMPRHCAKDTEVDGHVIPAGANVFPVFGAANVDPRAFPEPEKFDIDRKPRHFAFGNGIHQCVGAPLGRMQIRVLVESMFKLTANFTLDGVPQRNIWPHSGFSELKLLVTPV